MIFKRESFGKVKDIQLEKEKGIFMCGYGKEIFSELSDGFKVVGKGGVHKERRTPSYHS